MDEVSIWQILGVIFIILFWMGMGVWQIMLALRAQRGAPDAEWNWYTRKYWRQQLEARGVPLVDDELVEEVKRTWGAMQAPVLLCGGVVMCLFPFLIYALLWPRLYYELPDPYFPTYFVTAFIFVLIAGYYLGYLLSFWLIGRKMKRLGIAADSYPRQLLEYRSAVLRWLIGVYVLGNSVILFMTLLFEGILSLPELVQYDEWLIAGMAVVVPLLYLLGELLVERVVALPPLFIAQDAFVTAQVDELLCSVLLSQLQCVLVIGLGGLLLVQGVVLLPWYQSSTFLLEAWSYGPIFCLGVLGIAILGMRKGGRLGGEKSGWPWSASLAARADTAEMEAV